MPTSRQIVITLLISTFVLPAWNAVAAGRATSFTLPNGLQLVVIPDHALPVVTHMVFFKAGSADDPAGHSGVAHYLEHLMFKGTNRYPTGQFDQIVMRAGGTNNAYTSVDKTYYYEQVLAEALPRIMDLDADRMAGLSFDPKEAASELKVVGDEWRAYQDDPDSVLAESVNRSLYAKHPYARPVLGEPSEMRALTMADALAFHHDHYAPANAIVVVAGDVEPDAVLALARETYGKLAAGTPAGPRAVDTPMTGCADDTIEQRSSRRSRAEVTLYYRTPGASRMGPRTAAAFELLADILQSEVTSPLWDAMVTQERLANDLSVTHDLHIASGEFAITLEAAEGVAPDRLERSLRRAMIRLRGDGIAAEALAIAKRRWQANVVLSSDDQLAVATHYGEQLTSGRSLADIEGQPDLIASVTLPEINDILASALSNHCYLTAVLAPTGGSLDGGSVVRATARTSDGVR